MYLLVIYTHTNLNKMNVFITVFIIKYTFATRSRENLSFETALQRNHWSLQPLSLCIFPEK